MGRDEVEAFARVGEEGEAALAAAGLHPVSASTDRDRRGDLLRPRCDADAFPGNSLRQSLERGLPSEIDYRSGEIVLMGRLHDVATPANERLVAEVQRLAGPLGDADEPATSR